MIESIFNWIVDPTHAPYFIAIGSFCSAACAAMMVWLTLTNREYASRPDLVLEGWERGPTKGELKNAEYLSINTIRNIGGGVARNVEVRCEDKMPDGSYGVMMSGTCVAVGGNSSEKIVCMGRLYWDRLLAKYGEKAANILLFVTVSAWDQLGHKHIFNYHLSVNVRYLTVTPENEELIKNQLPGVPLVPAGVTVAFRLHKIEKKQRFIIKQKLKRSLQKFKVSAKHVLSNTK